MFSRVIDRSPDNIRYNINVTNPLKSSDPFIPITYDVTESQPVLGHADHYYLTIEKFLLPGDALPIFLFEVQDNQANPNLGIYSFTLSYGVDDYQEFIIYVPTETYLPTPAAPIPIQKFIDSYYYVYSYQNMIDMMNTTLATAFAALKAAHPGVASTTAPFFSYDAVSQLIKFVFETTYISDGISVSFTYATSIFCDAFNVIDNGPAAANGKNLTFILEDLPLTSNDYATGWLFLQQEYNTLSRWNSFVNIVFLTGTIPIINEFTPDTRSSGAIGQANFRPIVTDFTPSLDQAGDARGTLQYFPQGPYRLIDLISHDALYKISIRVFWQDRNNNLYPMYLAPGDTAQIKLLFIKKESRAW